MAVAEEVIVKLEVEALEEKVILPERSVRLLNAELPIIVPESDAVDAVAQMRRRRPVLEHVAEMAAAGGAMHFGAHHAVAPVDLFLN